MNCTMPTILMGANIVIEVYGNGSIDVDNVTLHDIIYVPSLFLDYVAAPKSQYVML